MSSELKTELCNKLLESGLLQESDVIRHSYTNDRLGGDEKNMARVQNHEKISPTLDTRCDCLGVAVKNTMGGGYNMLRIRKLCENEVMRLMAFEKKDTDAMKEAGLSKSAIYHCAGDSIVVACNIGLFGELLHTDYHKTIEDYVEKLVNEVK